MDLKNMKEQIERLKSEGKTEREIAEIMEDDFSAFADESLEHPELIEKSLQDDSLMVGILAFFLLRMGKSCGIL